MNNVEKTASDYFVELAEKIDSYEVTDDQITIDIGTITVNKFDLTMVLIDLIEEFARDCHDPEAKASHTSHVAMRIFNAIHPF